MQAQCEEHDCEHSPLPPARVRKMHTLTKGNISKLNALAHLSMLAARTERAAQVSPRHLRLAAGEILPAKNTVSARNRGAVCVRAVCRLRLVFYLVDRRAPADPAAGTRQLETADAKT